MKIKLQIKVYDFSKGIIILILKKPVFNSNSSPETKYKNNNIVMSAMIVIILMICYSLDPREVASQADNDGKKFIVIVTLIDDSEIDINLNFYDTVDLYIQEFPKYGHFNIDLSDALYSESTNGNYTTQIVLPPNLIKTNETFHVCIKGFISEGETERYCHELKNTHQNAPEEVSIIL